VSDIKIGFGLSGIKTEQFAIFKENYDVKKVSELITDLAFAVSPDTKILSTIATFSFQQRKKTFIKLEVTCQFVIIEEAWESFAIDNNVTIPKQFLEHMAMLTVGTCRGILFTKTEGTEFNRFLLPTINVSKMVKGDGVFELPK
jgi:hypothetical protein